jgi:hypothetical protein
MKHLKHTINYIDFIFDHLGYHPLTDFNCDVITYNCRLFPRLAKLQAKSLAASDPLEAGDRLGQK